MSCSIDLKRTKNLSSLFFFFTSLGFILLSFSSFNNSQMKVPIFIFLSAINPSCMPITTILLLFLFNKRIGRLDALDPVGIVCSNSKLLISIILRV